jgi:tRNA nucleotidyltransferase (CCA-adding enzyme)
VCARTRDQEAAVAAALSRTASPADAYLVLRGLPEVQVVWAGLTARSAAVRALVERHLADWRRRAAMLSGEDLRRLGVPQGPAVGSLLRGLVAAQVAGRVKDRAAAERWVRQRCAGQALAAGENTGELSGERGERVCPPSTSS